MNPSSKAAAYATAVANHRAKQSDGGVATTKPQQRPRKAAAPATSKRATKGAASFADLMGGFRSSEPVSESHPEKVLLFPEMVNGVATGQHFEVRVSAEITPKINASEVAAQIVAAGKKRRGEL